MRGNKILIINGPNINMLNFREEIYPNDISYQELCNILTSKDKDIEFYQSNHEGDIIDKIQSLVNDPSYQGLIINPGGYTHYSIAILDALYLLKNQIKVEVHFSDISKREEYRNYSVTSNGVDQVFMGEGIDSYIKAIDYIKNNGSIDE